MGCGDSGSKLVLRNRVRTERDVYNGYMLIHRRDLNRHRHLVQVATISQQTIEMSLAAGHKISPSTHIVISTAVQLQLQ